MVVGVVVCVEEGMSKMVKIQAEGAKILAPYPLVHGVTTRHGGVSEAPFDSLNLGLHAGDQEESVLVNREYLAQNIGVSGIDWVCANQVHGLKAVRVTAADKGKGALDTITAIKNCDALYTNDKEVPLLISVADCMPILLYDPVHHAISAVHAGWKGVKGDLPVHVLEAMKNDFNTDPREVIVYMGPHIGPHSFEVGEDLAEQFYKQFGADVIRYTPKTLGAEPTPHVYLAACVMQSLLKVGVQETNMEVSTTDTYRDKDCFSYRRDGGITGRMALFAMLK